MKTWVDLMVLVEVYSLLGSILFRNQENFIGIQNERKIKLLCMNR